MIRGFGKAAVVVMALTLVATVIAQTNYEDADPTGQTVIYWHQLSGDPQKALDDAVKEFNATNDYGITVKAEYQGSYPDVFKKMLPIVGTADAPNLVVAYQNQAATYQLADGLLDMKPLVNSPKWGISEADKADFFPGFFQSDINPSFGNARLGFPPQRSMEVMYYNSDWLKELRDAGKVSFDGPPTTPDQFEEAACAATANPFSKATTDGAIGYELSVDASRFASWTFAFGGDVFDYDNNTYSYDSDAAEASMTFLQGLFEKGCATIVSENYGDQTDFGVGRLMFAIGSSSGLTYYRSAAADGAGFDWSVGAIPHTTPDPVMNIYGASVSMPVAHSAAADVATWLFVKFYTSPEVQATFVKASNYFPVRQSVAADITDYFASHPAYKTAFDLLPYGRSEPPVPGYDFVRDMIAGQMSAIMDGADVKTTLEAANKDANDILADQLKDLGN